MSRPSADTTFYRAGNHSDFGLSLTVGLMLAVFVVALGWLCGVV